MHQIKPLYRLTHAEVRAMAQAAAERDEPLDACNVFPVESNQHAIFTSEYLAQLDALEAA